MPSRSVSNAYATSHTECNRQYACIVITICQSSIHSVDRTLSVSKVGQDGGTSRVITQHKWNFTVSPLSVRQKLYHILLTLLTELLELLHQWRTYVGRASHPSILVNQRCIKHASRVTQSLLLAKCVFRKMKEFSTMQGSVHCFSIVLIYSESIFIKSSEIFSLPSYR